MFPHAQGFSAHCSHRMWGSYFSMSNSHLQTKSCARQVVRMNAHAHTGNLLQIHMSPIKMLYYGETIWGCWGAIGFPNRIYKPKENLASEFGSSSSQARCTQNLFTVCVWLIIGIQVYLPLQASRSGLLFPRYVWITYAGDYASLASSATNTACSYDQLAQFLEGVFTLLPAAGNGPVNEDNFEVFACSLVYLFRLCPQMHIYPITLYARS